jgi:hypothetical protein
MKSIYNYLFGTEVYRKYTQDVFELGISSFKNIIKMFLILFSFITLITITIDFSNRNDVQIADIKTDSTLLVNKWRKISNDELLLYQWKKEKYIINLDDKNEKVDTVFYPIRAIKIDSTLLGKRIGNSGKTIFKNNNKGTFIEIKKDEGIKTIETEKKDYILDKRSKLSREMFVKIEDIMLPNTKTPETRGLNIFILGLIWLYLFNKTAKSFIRLFKKRIPYYSREPIYKKDRRFKTGRRQVSYKLKLSDYEDMTEEELILHRKQHLSRLIFFGIFLIFIWVNIVKILSS